MIRIKSGEIFIMRYVQTSTDSIKRFTRKCGSFLLIRVRMARNMQIHYTDMIL